MKYSASLLTVAAALATANANVFSLNSTVTASSQFPNATAYSSSYISNITTDFTTIVYASTAAATATANYTVYPSSCIVYVSGTGLPYTVGSQNITSSYLGGNATASPALGATSSVTYNQSYITYSSSLAAFPTTFSASASVNATFPTTTFNVGKSATVTSRAYPNATITSIYATVYTSSLGGVTTIYDSSYAAIPTISLLPICNGGYYNSSEPTSTASVNASSTAAANGTIAALGANGETKSDAVVVKGGLSAVLLSMGLAVVAL